METVFNMPTRKIGKILPTIINSEDKKVSRSKDKYTPSKGDYFIVETIDAQQVSVPVTKHNIAQARYIKSFYNSLIGFPAKNKVSIFDKNIF